MQNKKHKIQTKTRKNKLASKRGGKVFASGGYGCIFRPALKCMNQSRDRSKITKLMTKKHTNEEYNDIVQYKPFLEKIPNYTNYFLIDGFSVCEPAKLSSEDLQEFDKKCKALRKDNFTKKNINKKIPKLLALNMPDGGIDIGDYMETPRTSHELVKLNNALTELLLRGIIPMNELDIYHCDVKESNILVDANYTRLIDWGLSMKYDGTNQIPTTSYNRPFQYNVPFSIVLFNDTFSEMYAKFLSKTPNPDYYLLRTFVIDYIFVWNEKRGPGHIKFINNIMWNLFEHDLHNVDNDDIKREILETEYTYFYIIEYLAQILLKFTKDGKFYRMEYFKNVYLKNVDVWGLVITYFSMIEPLYAKYSEMNVNEKELFNKLKYIFIHYLYESHIEPINISDLVDDLNSLNAYFPVVNANARTSSKHSSTRKRRSL